MPNIFDGNLADLGAGIAMRRGIQEKLAQALILVEDPCAAQSGRAAGISEFYRLAGSQSRWMAAEAAPGPPASPQPMTPFRLFCLPVEDMLIEDPLSADPARIPRAAAAACWEALAEQLAAGALDPLEAELETVAGAASIDPAAIDGVGPRWWRLWAAVLSDAIAETRVRRTGILAGRSPRRLLAHAETIAAALRAAPAIALCKRLLGDPPIPRLDPARKAALREALQQPIGAGFGDPGVVAHVVAYRVENPAELFLAIADLDLGVASRDGLVPGEAREALILSRAAEQLAAIEEPTATADERAAAIDRIETAAAALAAAADLDKHGASSDFLREIARLQEALGRRLGAAIIPALRAEIAAFWGCEAATLPVSVAAILAAESSARALTRLSRSAALIGMAAAVRPAIAAIAEDVEGAVARVAIALADEASNGERAQRAATLIGGIRIIELLAGSDRAADILAPHEALLDQIWACPDLAVE